MAEGHWSYPICTLSVPYPYMAIPYPYPILSIPVPYLSSRTITWLARANYRPLRGHTDYPCHNPVHGHTLYPDMAMYHTRPGAHYSVILASGHVILYLAEPSNVSYNALNEPCCIINSGRRPIMVYYGYMPGTVYRVHPTIPYHTPATPHRVHLPVTVLHSRVADVTAQEWATGLRGQTAYLARRAGPSDCCTGHRSTAS